MCVRHWSNYERTTGHAIVLCCMRCKLHYILHSFNFSVRKEINRSRQYPSPPWEIVSFFFSLLALFLMSNLLLAQQYFLQTNSSQLRKQHRYNIVPNINTLNTQKPIERHKGALHVTESNWIYLRLFHLSDVIYGWSIAFKAIDSFTAIRRRTNYMYAYAQVYLYICYT